ncbi:hypothetical protein PHMEG_0005682 [Phytophthora megakarya]|uniref:Uncharacterized protein n=1 Tax=Phytophthora megakarya TaxID=4795 RepID=A0A225WQS8_9STRA|nr:hypothetical protein PHMEG_0005682 [Phytophthora megakarya]
MTKLKSNLSAKPATATRSSKKKKIKAARTKLKAPDSESEDVNKPRSTIAKDIIEQAYHRKILSETLLQDPVLAIIQVRQIGDLTDPVSKPNASSDRLSAVKILLDLLQEAGQVTGEFDPDFLFEMELGAIQAAIQDLYDSLKILVGEHLQTPDLNYQTGSSHYASATSEPDSDSSRAPQRMPLGLSGAKNLRSRVGWPDQRPAGPSQTLEKPDRQQKRQIPAGRTTPTTNSTGSSNTLDEYFQMAMNRFLKEQSLVTVQPPPLGTQDIDMESVGTSDPDSGEYDPDDLGIPSSSGHDSGRAAAATAVIGSGDQRPAGPSQTLEKPDRQQKRQIPAGRTTPTTNSTGSSNTLDEYFQMAMNRFLKEQSLVTVQPPPLGTQDIDMESVGTSDPDSGEYDPDDLGIPSSSGHDSGRAAAATAVIGSGGSSMIQRVRIPAILDLKEFTEKDMDEDHTRAWIGEAKSAFQQDQATEEGKSLTFADLMVGPAKN